MIVTCFCRETARKYSYLIRYLVLSYDAWFKELVQHVAGILLLYSTSSSLPPIARGKHLAGRLISKKKQAQRQLTSQQQQNTHCLQQQHLIKFASHCQRQTPGWQADQQKKTSTTTITSQQQQTSTPHTACSSSTSSSLPPIARGKHLAGRLISKKNKHNNNNQKMP